MKPVEVIVNGKPGRIVPPLTVAQFIGNAGWKTTQVVVEYNGVVLPRHRLTETTLTEGDRLEVVVPVAGG